MFLKLKIEEVVSTYVESQVWLTLIFKLFLTTFK